jgi:hypothetical protein
VVELTCPICIKGDKQNNQNKTPRSHLDIPAIFLRYDININDGMMKLKASQRGFLIDVLDYSRNLFNDKAKRRNWDKLKLYKLSIYSQKLNIKYQEDRALLGIQLGAVIKKI